jgi:putative FmdB family regulatory protein
MPTYEYSCKSCGTTFEIVQSFKAKPLRRHDQCGGELQKVFHSRGVVFKGSGFYSTDSRSKRTPAKAKSDTDTATTTTTTATTTDKKQPDQKPEPKPKAKSKETPSED